MSADPKITLVADNDISQSVPADAREVLQHLKKLRHFTGSATLFWAAYVRQSAYLCKASFACVLQKQPQQWICLAQEASEAFQQPQLDSLWQTALDTSDRSFEQGFASAPVAINLPSLGYPFVVTVALEMPATEAPALLVLLVDKHQDQRYKEALVRSQLIADIPANLNRHHDSEASAKPVATTEESSNIDLLAHVLDVNSLIQKQARFGAAAMVLVNEIASRFKCVRVSLGWLQHEYVEVMAISHLDRLEKKTDACQQMQSVFEECFDQDEELNWPSSLETGAVLLAHERYSRTQNVACLLSLPLRVDDQTVGVLLCERNDRELSLDESRSIRLCLDQVQCHLQRLHHRQQWLGERFKQWLKQTAQTFIGPEHTLLKLGGVLAALVLLFILFGHWSYRVELPATLETDQVAFISAPFDGHVSDVNVHAGDWVEPDAPLLQLDTQELLLKESEAHSDVLRYTREAEKARASGAYADMRVATARQAQAQAALERMQYYLRQGTLKAPFKGVVVEGDKEKLLGAPLNKGDTVFKIAQIDGLYAKLVVSERDVRELSIGDTGHLKLLSRPEKRFAVEITDIIPVAEVKSQQGNVFIVKARFSESALDWWRPGMSGLAKIDVGDRRIVWIFTHRLNDFLRMRLWW